ncbi:helix-turn-helix transcriptional regulator [Streptomyces sp. NPDC059649]|uniref:helix-turn-helix transcriptional regulator n=1 Tax=Streptomyces sp. NPDC059649 TaxID=3346895 RepID=UPI00369FB234
MSFGSELRQRRQDAGLSLSALASQVHVTRAHLHNVETGRRAPSGDLAEASDITLQAGGRLVAAFQSEDTERQRQAATRRTLAASLATSRDLMELADLELDQLQAGVEETAVDYLAAPPAPMLMRADALRRDALQRLRDYRHGPHERADLYVAAGRLSGILAYAALDLGNADAALEHARAAGRCAQYAGDTELLMWVRGTQSLIARFSGDYGIALEYVRDGLQYAGNVPGTGEARLLCGEVQCLANLGDSRAANQTLRLAEQARERANRPDSLAGLFEFSETKQRYYAASSLIWLNGGDDARTAAAEAMAAIASWQQMPPEQRSLDDERLCHIYLATAEVQLGEVEAAAEAMAPVLALPTEAQISWINKRAHRVGSILAAPRYHQSSAASDLREAIAALGA